MHVNVQNISNMDGHIIGLVYWQALLWNYLDLLKHVFILRNFLPQKMLILEYEIVILNLITIPEALVLITIPEALV